MYFAQIDFFRRVLKVVVADQDFVDRQAGMWIQCDENGVSPKNFPNVGDTYDYDRNAFISTKPYPSYTLNETTCRWESPTPMPQGMSCARWNEETQAWYSEE